MAIDQTGIMALPEADQAAAPTLSLEDSYDAVKSALQEARPDAASDMDAAMQEMTAEIRDLSDEELDAMIDIVQQMHDNPEQYQQLRAQLIADDQAEEDDFPADYDPEYLAMVMGVLLEAKRSRTSPVSQTPQGFAKGGIASAAESLARKGRYGDTMLAHINPREARLLKKHGGSGRINPATGLREYGWLKKIFKKIGNAVKKFLGSKIGKVIGTIVLGAFLGPGAFGITGANLVGASVAMPLASGITTLAAGGNLKDALKSAAFTYIASPGNPVSNYVSSGIASVTPLTGTALQAATSGVIGTGVGLLSGQKLSDAVKSGFTSAALTAAQAKFFNQAPSKAPGASEAPTTTATPSGTPPVNTLEMASIPPSGTSASPLAGTGIAPEVPITAAGSALPETTAQGATTTGFKPASEPAYPLSNELPQGITKGTGPSTAGAQPSTGDVYKGVPTVSDSISKMLGLGQNELSLENFKQGASDLFMPNTATQSQINAAARQLVIENPGMSFETALKQATANMSPGVLRTYGPAVVGGLGLMGAMGGFEQKPAELTEEQKSISNILSGGPGSARDLLNRYPNRFYIQGLPEVPYFGGSVLPPVTAANGGEIRGYNTGGTVNWGPNIPIDSTIFPRGWNWETYLRLNPDLGSAGIDTEEEARRHYTSAGYIEGRRYADPVDNTRASTAAANRIQSKYSTAGVEALGRGLRDPGGQLGRLHEDYTRWWQQTKPGDPATPMGSGITVTREGWDTGVLRNPNTGETTSFGPTTNYEELMKKSPSWSAGWEATYGARPTENPYIAGLPKPDQFQLPSAAFPVQKATGGIASVSEMDPTLRALMQQGGGLPPITTSIPSAAPPNVGPINTGMSLDRLRQLQPELNPNTHPNLGLFLQGLQNPDQSTGVQSIDDLVARQIASGEAANAAMSPAQRLREQIDEVDRTATTDREKRDRIFLLSPEEYKRRYYTLPAERMIPEGGFKNVPETEYWRNYTREVGLSPELDAQYRSWLQTDAGRAARTGFNDYVGGPVTLANFDPAVRDMIVRAAAPGAAPGAAPAAAAPAFNAAQEVAGFSNRSGSAPIESYAVGGIAGLGAGGYPRRTGQISGPGTEKSDSIPAMLSDGEFVMTAKAVRGAGNGSRREGAKKMYKLMHQLERNASRG